MKTDTPRLPWTPAGSIPQSAIVTLFFLAILILGVPSRALLAAGQVPSPPFRISSPFIEFTLDPATGTYGLVDKAARVAWRSNPFLPRFGEVTLKTAGGSRRVNLDRCDVRPIAHGLEAVFHPLAEQPASWLRVTIRLLDDRQTLEFAYTAADPAAIDSVRLLDEALGITAPDPGYVAVPVREGLLIPADSGLAFTNRFDTYEYEGCHMAMLGVVKNGGSILITWSDPYVAAELRSVLPPENTGRGKQVLTTSLVLRKSARSFRLQCCGQGDYVTLAKTYRQIARTKGWLVPWSKKLPGHPDRAKLFGAINYKLWSILSRQMNDESTQEVSARLNWTFAEAAQIAEHLKNDLKLDRVLFTMGGWIHRGYDNQHPDILPAAPECGGDAGLADCAQRVRQLGYLFCLHDNYQDIYRDSPSWNTNLIMRRPDGTLAVGGKWDGGRAYLTCSPKALDLARRPQNLTAVRQLTAANAYFIDTTYAAGLQECFDPAHPLTRADDLRWKQALSDYARETFGVFGSECGREWAVPHSDFFEGLTGVSGHAYHNEKLPAALGATVIPLFEIVYRDGIAMYGKYGYNTRSSAGYVVQHVLLGRPLNYHDIPAHLYWKLPPREDSPAATRPEVDPAAFMRGDQGWTAGLHPLDRFVKNTYEVLSPLNELTAQLPLTRHQFLTPDRQVQRTVFGEGKQAVEVIANLGRATYAHQSRAGHAVQLPPFGFVIESARFVAFHASSWNGSTYAAPVLFTLRSLDGRPLDRSARVRVYHGFGDPRLQLGPSRVTVEKEAVLPGR